MTTSHVERRIAALEGGLDALRPKLRLLERQIGELEQELAELRVLARQPVVEPAPSAEQPAPPAPAPVPPASVSPPPAPPRPEPWPPQRPAVRQAPPTRKPQPRPRREVDLTELLGARALAWAGGLVTLLGVVFFFVLAVDRGWIGPLERVGLGALASISLFAAGVVVRARFGNVHSALAAAGAGVAGGFATLLAAAALYGLVADLPALLLAAAIAATGVALALRWGSQTLAGIGLVGATLVPLTLVFEGGLSVIGTAFVAIVFAATAVVAVRWDWRTLLGAGLAASALQIVVLVLDRGADAGGDVVALAAVFVALYLAVGIVLERRGARPLERLATTLVLVSAILAVLSAIALLGGTLAGVDSEGAALVGIAAAYAAVAAALFRRERRRDLSALAGAIALAVAAIALADLLSGTSLAAAWAAQAAVLAWLGARIAEPRYRLASLAYLVLAAAYTLSAEAPPTDLFTQVAAPAAGVLSVVAVGLSVLVFARHARGWEELEERGAVSRLLGAVGRARELWRVGALCLAPALGAYALALVVLELVERGGARPAFPWGHVGVTAGWTGGAALVLLAGAAAGRRPVQLAGLAWLGAALLKLALFDLDALPARQAAWAALALGLGHLLASYGVHALRREVAFDLGLVANGAAALSGGLVYGALTELVRDADARGLAVLGAAGAYAVLGATLFPRAGRRDPSTLLWGVAFVLAVAASLALVESPTGLVAAWSLGAGALALLAPALSERRLLLGAAVLTALALGRTLLELAPPTDLFVPASGAADGVPALVLAIGALVALLLGWARVSAPAGDALDDALDRLRATRAPQAVTAVAVLTVYTLSLSILGVAQALGGGDATTDFQRGHTAVSALWGLIGLLALRRGLLRGEAAPKLAGFALFGVALAKLFLYDLTMLSSVTRALSFLAVGAVLLVAGFFYQRLSARAGEPA